MFKKIAAVAAMTLFVMGGAPAVGQSALSPLVAPAAVGDPCYDGCMINCLKTGDILICEDTCFQVTCLAAAPPTKMTRIDGL